MKGKKRYSNLDHAENVKTLKDILQWRRERKRKKKDLSFVVPQCDGIETAFLQRNRSEPTATWIGHSTFLLQIGGLNIVTDPIWAERMGFEKRLSPPGISLSALPHIDVVLISHSHYDHLHFKSLFKLSGQPTHLVPQGLASAFRKKGLGKTEELSWWQSIEINGVEFTFVPAQHWSKRTPWDTNTSHWGGWVIRNVSVQSDNACGKTVYFAGDSGYFRGFHEIGQRFAIDCVLMPIGAYEPEWFMGVQHVTPEQAVQAFLDTRGKMMIPMHYGAFRLADDTPQEALERLLAEWDHRGLDSTLLKILRLGETLRLTDNP